MVKAHIITKTGAKITIEGTPSEVAEIVRKAGVEQSSATALRSSPRRTKGSQKATPVNLVSGLIDGGFFRKPKDLAAIKIALEEMGHYYPVTSLSPTLLRLVRKRQLRRLKENKRWLYTG
jgi:hypothetical protein